MTRPFTCFLFYLLLFRKVNILPAFASSPWKCACNKNGHIILRPILEIVKSQKASKDSLLTQKQQAMQSQITKVTKHWVKQQLSYYGEHVFDMFAAMVKLYTSSDILISSPSMKSSSITEILQSGTSSCTFPFTIFTFVCCLSASIFFLSHSNLLEESSSELSDPEDLRSLASSSEPLALRSSFSHFFLRSTSDVLLS